MDKSNDKLFFLIAKLSSSEKGYINKQLKSSNPDSHLLKLFVTICKIKPRDEQALKPKIKERYIVNNLAAVKKQLFDRLLKILHDYHNNKGSLRKVYGMLDDIKLLFDKGLYVACEKMVKKAIKICDDFEYYGLKLHLLEWKKRILVTYFYTYKSLDKEVKRFDEKYTTNHQKNKTSW